MPEPTLVTFESIIEEFNAIQSELKERIPSLTEADEDFDLNPYLMNQAEDAADADNYAKSVAYILQRDILILFSQGKIESANDLTSENIQDMVTAIISEYFELHEHIPAGETLH